MARSVKYLGKLEATVCYFIILLFYLNINKTNNLVFACYLCYYFKYSQVVFTYNYNLFEILCLYL